MTEADILFEAVKMIFYFSGVLCGVVAMLPIAMVVGSN